MNEKEKRDVHLQLSGSSRLEAQQVKWIHVDRMIKEYIVQVIDQI